MKVFGKCLLLLLVWFTLGSGVSPVCVAQNPSKGKITNDKLQLVPFRVGDKWGLSDTAGNLIIQPKFDDIYIMNNGLYKVRKKKRYGIIDKRGKVVVPVRFHEIGDFYYKGGSKEFGYAFIQTRSEMEGYVDSLGRIALPARFLDSAPLGNGYFMLGFPRIPPIWGSQNIRRGIYKDGKIIVRAKYENIETLPSGNFVVENFRGKGGILDLQGKKIIKPIYHTFTDFDEGLASVGYLKKGVYIRDYIHHFIEKNGKPVFNQIFEDIKMSNDGFAFSYGLAAVSIDGRNYGFINTSGEAVIDFIYEDVTPFHNGFSFVKKGGLWGIIDTKGNTVEQIKFESIKWRDGYIVEAELPGRVRRTGYFGGPDKKTLLIYDYMEGFKEGRASVVGDRGYGFIDINGNEVIPCSNNIRYGPWFSEGLVNAEFEKKLGFVDTLGKFVIKAQFDGGKRAVVFSGGAALVRKGYEQTYINRKGQLLAPFIQYDARDYSFPTPDFKEGYGSVLVEVLPPSTYNHSTAAYQFVDTTGRRISDLKFIAPAVYENGLAMVCQEEGCGFIDTNGKVIIPLQFYFESKQAANGGYTYHHGDMFRVKLGENDRRVLGYMSKTGKMYWSE